MKNAAGGPVEETELPNDILAHPAVPEPARPQRVHPEFNRQVVQVRFEAEAIAYVLAATNELFVTGDGGNFEALTIEDLALAKEQLGQLRALLHHLAENFQLAFVPKKETS